MAADYPTGPTYNVDELELTYAVPVGDMGSSYIEHVRMTLTDLALKNLLTLTGLLAVVKK